MDKITIIESLKTCLGKPLASAKRHLLKLEGIVVSELDLAEVVLSFDVSGGTRYFSWEQRRHDFELSVTSKSHLREQSFSEIATTDDALLSKFLGKRCTLFELYEDEFGSLVAAVLRFETDSLVIAVGYDNWNVKTQRATFSSFAGDDVFLWTAEEFVDALRKQNLKRIASFEE